jgi:hypothetical protein
MGEASVANGTSGASCCSLENSLLTALTMADQYLNFSLFDADGNGYVDMITVRASSHFTH